MENMHTDVREEGLRHISKIAKDDLSFMRGRNHRKESDA